MRKDMVKYMIKKQALSAMVNLTYNYLDRNPEKHMLNLVKLFDKLDRKDNLKPQRDLIRKIIEDKDSNWYKYILDLWDEIDPGVRKTFFRNFLFNASLMGGPKHRKLQKKYDCNIPFAILMDPTSACNLHCSGCWAAQYGNRQSLSLKALNSIIEQGKEIGVHFYAYSGGEPLVRKKDIIKLCDKHKDCIFTAFTNGTLIDEAFADEMLRVKNFVPAISIEGFEEETDSRRGKGTYQAVIHAMEILKERKLAFGTSCCYTRKNAKVVGSEAFIDDMIARGAKFAWFFTYIPVGADAVPELMVTADQREYMYRQVNRFRKTKPIFAMDFWNDGEYAQGCVAGGRRYLHINAAGDIEPCAFIHYSDTNIHDATVLDALRAPLFMQYYKNQPFNGNHLRPCPLLDNPEALVKMIESTGAKSTELLHPEDVNELKQKCTDTARRWARTADRLWFEAHDCFDCRFCRAGQDSQTLPCMKAVFEEEPEPKVKTEAEPDVKPEPQSDAIADADSITDSE